MRKEYREFCTYTQLASIRSSTASQAAVKTVSDYWCNYGKRTLWSWNK